MPDIERTPHRAFVPSTPQWGVLVYTACYGRNKAVLSECLTLFGSNMTIAPIPSNETLPSNTGYDSQNRSGLIPSNYSCKVDWLDVTLRAIAGPREADDLINYLEIATGQNMHFSPHHPAFNGITWDGSGRSEKGIMAWYKAPYADETGEMVYGSLKLAFPGSVLTPIVTNRVLEWLVFLEDEHEIDCTRIDIALDDHQKSVKLGKINRARKLGNFFNCTYTEAVSSSLRGQDEAITLYFGARASDKRLRIYDKTLESKGKILGNRWEAQFRRRAAGEAFKYWCSVWKSSPESVSALLSRLVLGIIDFRERGDDDTDRNRCQPLRWFSALIVAVNADPLRIVVQPEEKTIQRSINWVKRSVASTLAMIKISLGTEFLPYMRRMITEGDAKLNNIKREIGYMTGPHELLY